LTPRGRQIVTRAWSCLVIRTNRFQVRGALPVLKPMSSSRFSDPSWRHSPRLLGGAFLLLSSPAFGQGQSTPADPTRAAIQQCALATKAGPRRQAIESCESAVRLAPTAEAMFYLVRSLVSGKQKPTPDEMLRAKQYADGAIKREPTAPWGFLALCDIATRWGDPSMIQSCMKELSRVAPKHEETLRLAQSAPPRVPAPTVVGLVLFLFAVVGTVGHATRRAIRRRRRASAAATFTAAALAILALGAIATEPASAEQAGSAAAQDTELPPGHGHMYPINEADLLGSIPTPEQRDANPLQFGYFLQDLLDRAEAAVARGDHGNAARYYGAVATAVPDRAAGFSKLCRELEAYGEREEALKACDAALGLQGVVVEDFVRFVRLHLAKKTALTPEEIEKTKAAIAHLRAQENGAVLASHLSCEFGVKLEDVAMLETCTKVLAQTAPKDAKTISFQWALALKKGEPDVARRLIERAEQAGVAPEGLERMREATAKRLDAGGGLEGILDTRILTIVFVAVGATLLALVVRQRRAMRSKAAA